MTFQVQNKELNLKQYQVYELKNAAFISGRVSVVVTNVFSNGNVSFKALGYNSRFKLIDGVIKGYEDTEITFMRDRV